MSQTNPSSPGQSPEEILFAAALKRPPDERAAFLDAACRGDASLRARLEALLAAHELPDALPELPDEIPRPETSAVPTEDEKLIGRRIGRYTLLEVIGEGGCGVVYAAEQTEPVRRRVALKLIKPGMNSKAVIARFEAERQALALMDHPNIAKVLDGGTTEAGLPYFVMELVRGVKITEHCDRQKLSTEERLKLFIQVCQAVQHAHQKGIIHRDLKPSNVFVTLFEGVAVPKVIDFGIAKAIGSEQLTDKTIYTALDQFIGTPAYMSPEQAERREQAIDVRTDVYSLGVLLYELLTGRPPFDTNALLESGFEHMLKIIREQDPPRPSSKLSTLELPKLTVVAHVRQAEPFKLVRAIRGDLDWIAVKCLEKDRERRYDSASALANDLQRHLQNEPILARPPSKFYEFQKSVRRHKVGFAATAAIILVLAVGVVVSTREAVRAKRAERAAAGEAARSAQVADLLKDMLKGVGPSVALGRDTTILREILDKTARRLDALKGQPEVEADLRETIGTVYRDLSDYPESEAMLQKSLDLRRQLYGNENAPVANALNELALTERKHNKITEAEADFLKALAIRRKLFGEENLEVAASLFGLAEARRGEKKAQLIAWTPDEIERDYREALRIQRKLLGNQNLEVANSLVGLGCFQEYFWKLPEAVTSLREALQIQRQLLGNENPAVAYTLQNLGLALWRLHGPQSDAAALLGEALTLDEKLLGDSRDTVIALLQYSVAATNISETLAMQRKAAAISAKVFGTQNLQTIEAERYLTASLLLEAEFTEARSLVLDPAALRTPSALNQAARILATSTYPEWSDGSNAVLFAEQAVAATGRKNPIFLDTLAAAYAENGQFDKAVGTEKEALALITVGPMKGPFGHRLSLYTASTAFHNTELLVSTVYFFTVLDKVEALLRAGAFAEAEMRSWECLDLGKILLPDEWPFFTAQSLQGGCLLGQKKYAEAGPLLLSGYAGLKQREDRIPEAVREDCLKTALDRLVQFYQATGQPEKAAALFR